MRRAASVTLSSTVRCGNRLNCWKTIPMRLPHPRDVGAAAGDLAALEEDPARVERLEQVDAAQQRALPAAARADHDEHLAGRDLQVDPVEHEVVAEALPHRLEPDHLARRARARRRRGFLRHRPPPRGAHSRARRRVPAVPSNVRLMRRLPPQGVAAHLRTATWSCRTARPPGDRQLRSSAAEALRDDDAWRVSGRRDTGRWSCARSATR